jgi:hypothetical protein
VTPRPGRARRQIRCRARPGAAHLHDAAAWPRSQARAARRRQYVAEDEGARPPRRRGRGFASRQPAPTWRRSSRPACRRCGLRRCAKLRALDAIADEELVGHRARQSDRSGGAKSVRRDHAARVPAAQIRRSHPRDRGAQRDRSAGRRTKCAEVFGGRLAFVPYLMPGFGLAKKRSRSSSGQTERRAHPRQARHRHLRRRARAKPTSA